MPSATSLEIDANDADTWYFLGASYAQAKQFPEAIDAFQHALKLNPLHASAEFGLSRAYQQSADIDHAREHLKKFQYITQNKLGAPISLAYGEQGQYSRAEESPSAVLKVPAQIKVRFVDVTERGGTADQMLAGEGDGCSFVRSDPARAFSIMTAMDGSIFFCPTTARRADCRSTTIWEMANLKTVTRESRARSDVARNRLYGWRL